ncbi:MAG: glycosyltransferase family 39 protein, partial [Proteobacteria bacterium]|nr:glycosyltransferase family 39 protein [Pseudomonadota bacterium]
MLSPRASVFYGRLGLGLFALALAVVLLTFDDYGVTWDAPYHVTNGENVVAYYASWFTDRRVLTYHNLFLYGGAYDALAELAREILPFGDYETNHLINALVGLLGVAGCWKLADFLAGRRAALFAALLLLAVPAWYGHSFNNPKDIPFAAGMAWSLYYAARFVAALPSPTAGLTAKLGLALGLTLGVRVGGVLAVFYLAAGIAGYLLLRWSAMRPVVLMREAGHIAANCVLPALGIAYVLMLLCWPWAQQHPLGNPIAALRLFSHIDWDLKVLFEGRLVDSMHLPATYLPVYFAVTLPELILVLLAAAVP